MAVSIILLIVGTLLLIKGADFFVGGASRLARALKVPPLVIGLTLVSMGTSAPEASVSINGAVNGMNDMSISNVVGSNIFNTLFILGVSSLIIPLTISRDMKKFDVPIMTALYAVLMIFAFAITPYRIDVAEAAVMIVLFTGYTAFLTVRAVRAGKREKAAASTATVLGTTENAALAQNTAATSTEKESKPKKRPWTERIPLWLSLILAAAGLAGIIFGGDMVVKSASAIAKALGMSESLVGLTIVAVGTSLPELVTSIVAAVKKENDIAVGNVIGSNIFNIVFILGISSAISAPTVSSGTLIDMAVMAGSGVLILVIALCRKQTSRWQGALMTALYVAYLAYIIVRN